MFLNISLNNWRNLLPVFVPLAAFSVSGAGYWGAYSFWPGGIDHFSVRFMSSWHGSAFASFPPILRIPLSILRGAAGACPGHRLLLLFLLQPQLVQSQTVAWKRVSVIEMLDVGCEVT